MANGDELKGKSQPDRGYAIASVLAVLIGAGLSWLLWRSGTKIGWEFKPAEGVSAFAFIYVITQASERIVQFAITLAAANENFADNKKRDAQKQLRNANSTLNGNPTLTDIARGVGADASPSEKAVQEAAASAKEASTTIDQARTNLSTFGTGVSFAVGAMLVSFFHFDFLKAMGVSHTATTGAWNTYAVIGSVVVTAVVVSGGSKGLHDLLSKVQKSKEATEASAATTPAVSGS